MSRIPGSGNGTVIPRHKLVARDCREVTARYAGSLVSRSRLNAETASELAPNAAAASAVWAVVSLRRVPSAAVCNRTAAVCSRSSAEKSVGLGSDGNASVVMADSLQRLTGGVARSGSRRSGARYGKLR